MIRPELGFYAVALFACRGVHAPTAAQPGATRSPPRANDVEELPFLACATATGTLDDRRDAPAPRVELLRKVELKQPGALADVYVWPATAYDGAIVQAFWTTHAASGEAIRARSAATEIRLLQLDDDRYYAGSTPWTLDGIWPEGVLVHREADENGPELLWAPRNGAVRMLAERPSSFGAFRASVAGDDLMTVTQDPDDVQMLDVTCHTFDGAVREHGRVTVPAEADAVLARDGAHCALAFVTTTTHEASLQRVTGSVPPRRIDLGLTIPPRVCEPDAGASDAELFAVPFEGGAFDFHLGPRGACVHRFVYTDLVASPTPSGIVAIDNAGKAPRALHCVVTSKLLPSPEE